jgi:outer membrane protein assembly factor BamB
MPKYKLTFAVVSFAFLVSSCPATAVANDWAQWRGPNRDGISPETRLLESWPKGGPTLVWRTTDLGGGYSTPSVADGRIFGMSYRGDDEVVWALDAKTGKEQWVTRIAKAARVDYGQGSRSTPTVDGKKLFALGVSGDLVCLDVASGAKSWQRNLEKDFGGQRPGWGYSESILVDGDRVVCTPGGAKGAIVALSKNSGELVWQSKEFTDPPAYASLVIMTDGGVRQYVQMTHSNVVGVAAESGRLLWRYARNGPTAAVPTPVVSKNMVYATSGYNAGCHMIKLVNKGGTITPEQAYANDVMTNHHGGVVLVGEHLYGFSDSKGWTCQNFKTGEMVWNDRGKLGKGAISFADGRLYLRSERGTVALIEASTKGYNELGRFEQPDRSPHQAWPHPVIANGRLLLRDQDILLCYDVRAEATTASNASSR